MSLLCTGRRCLLAVFAAVLMLNSSGCLMVDFAKESMSDYKRMITPRKSTYRDFTDEPDDYSYVAEIGRGNEKIEPSPNGKLWSQYFMSEKARSIERNFNIEH